jgi:hypothetical protein
MTRISFGFAGFGLAFATIGGLSGALALGGCSSDSTKPSVDAGVDVAAADVPPDLGPPLVTISGTAAPHPLTTPLGMNPAADFSQLAVAVVDPAVVIASPTAPPLKGGALDTSAGNCGATGCAWSFDNVDIGGISLGLVGIVDDTRTPATSRLWVKTGTGSGASDFINMIKSTRAPITDRRLFAVSKATEAALSMFAMRHVPDTTIAAGTLEARGFMLGTVIGTDLLPVAGATVAIPPTESRLSILYPDDTFSDVGRTSTASHGTILVVPKMPAPTSIVTSWTVTAPGGTWPTLTAGTSPGTAFVLLFPQNP